MCVCKAWAPVGEDSDGITTLTRAYRLPPPLASFIIMLSSLPKWGHMGLFPLYPPGSHTIPVLHPSVLFLWPTASLRWPPAHPCPPLGGPHRPVDEKLPRRFPRLFPPLPISPQYGFVPPPPEGGRGIQFPFSWCSTPAILSGAPFIGSSCGLEWPPRMGGQRS